MNRVWLAAALVGAPFLLQAQGQNPFSPPRATVHEAPERSCDLIHLEVVLDVDYPSKTIKGYTVNTLAPLKDGLKEVVLNAGKPVSIAGVSVDGHSVSVTREGNRVHIPVQNAKKGKAIKVRIDYSCSNAAGTGFGSGGGGWHWINPTQGNTSRVGFWTQGESIYNSEWAPTWDYPNDFATTQTTTTVQSDWDVVGNGVLTSSTLSADKKRKTYVWTMKQPHATYLLALYGGPFDIKKDKWKNADLWYVVPRGSGYLIDDSFGHTKDMLTFFSKTLGVDYAWPKYAQCAMYDFGGGMENVSATILGEGSLTEARDGYYQMDSLNSHELGHQWFGDLVTCQHWGDTWLNESFATYMQFIYFEHSRGADAYAQEIDGAMLEYFAEARRYKRPISTKLYSDPDAMFDSHSYPKGGVVLHTLRRMLGDEAYYKGLNHYLTKFRHQPVVSNDLRDAMTEATGVDCKPFWAQWIDKPGHPVLDYTWSYDAGKVKLTVKQTQDTKDGTPVYDIQAKVGLFTDSGMNRAPLHLTKTEETFEFPVKAKPAAVVLDPDHDFLRQIATLHWTKDEAAAILRWSPNAPDRAEAMRMILAEPTDADIKLSVAMLEKDNGIAPTFEQVQRLANLSKPDLRSFWIGQLSHKNFSRRAQAVTALSKLPADAETTRQIRSLVTEDAPIQVVVNAINALKAWDAKGNRDIFEKASKFKDRRNRIQRAANSALNG